MINYLKRVLKIYFFRLKVKNSYFSISADISNNSQIQEFVKVFDFVRLGNVKIDSYSYINRNCTFENTEIGKFCSIGPNVLCGLGSHPIDYLTTYPGMYSNNSSGAFSFSKNHIVKEWNKEVVIGNDVWIGANSLILGGIEIGNGAIVAAGSVVTKNVPPYAIVGGVPAKVIKFRFHENSIKVLLQSEWWNFDFETIKYLSTISNNEEKFISFLNNRLNIENH